jgi:hypothetical protein
MKMVSLATLLIAAKPGVVIITAGATSPKLPEQVAKGQAALGAEIVKNLSASGWRCTSRA